LVLWPVCVGVGVELIIRRGTRQLLAMLVVGLGILVNECFVKPLVSQPRPDQSCLTSCGMPSSHSLLSIGLLTLVTTDTILRIASSRGQLPSATFEQAPLLTLTPVWPKPAISSGEATVFLSIWWIILFPIPFMRVAIHDHSALQATVGSLIGLSVALVMLMAFQWWLNRHAPPIGDRCIGNLLLHNYWPLRHCVGDSSSEGMLESRRLD